MARLYELGYSAKDIGSRFGLCGATVEYHLKRFGIALRHQKQQWETSQLRKKRSGPNHWQWNGGRKNVQGGYVEVMAPGHPYNRNGYLLEHRLIVENYLRERDPSHPGLDEMGYLRRDWVVHHINGQKADNRIANLEPLRRGEHHSWMHYHAETARLKMLLDQHGISY